MEQIFGQRIGRRLSVGDDARADRLQVLGMLASALAGRAVAVAGLQPGEPAWTDGQTIYVDAAARPARATRSRGRAGVDDRGRQPGARRGAAPWSAIRGWPSATWRSKATAHWSRTRPCCQVFWRRWATATSRVAAIRPPRRCAIAAGRDGARRPGAGVRRDPCGEGDGRVRPGGQTRRRGEARACAAAQRRNRNSRNSTTARWTTPTIPTCSPARLAGAASSASG